MWWAEEPDHKRRPVLVMTRTEAIPVLHSVVVVPATRTVRSIPTEILVGPEDGMPQECAFTFDNLSLVNKSFLLERICKLGADKMHDACRAVAASFDCPWPLA